MKRLCTLLVTIGLLAMLSVTAFATTELHGTVWFDGKRLNSDYTSASVTDAIGELEPGDDIAVVITLRNDYSRATDWWMNNEIINSFETNGPANGGAYTYRLGFKGPNIEDTYYDSETVGGESEPTGMQEATNSLKNFFRLDNLEQGETGTVTLYISLDGETQGNIYQLSLANLEMNFAVELADPKPDEPDRPGHRDDPYDPPTPPEPSEPTPPGKNERLVRTGDETAIAPYLIGSFVSGLALLIIAILRMRRAARDRQGGQMR